MVFLVKHDPRAGVENHDDGPGGTGFQDQMAVRRRPFGTVMEPPAAALALKGRTRGMRFRINSRPAQLRHPAERDERVSDALTSSVRRLNRSDFEVTRSLEDAPADAQERGSGRRNVRHRQRRASLVAMTRWRTSAVDGRCHRGRWDLLEVGVVGAGVGEQAAFPHVDIMQQRGRRPRVVHCALRHEGQRRDRSRNEGCVSKRLPSAFASACATSALIDEATSGLVM